MHAPSSRCSILVLLLAASCGRSSAMGVRRGPATYHMSWPIEIMGVAPFAKHAHPMSQCIHSKSLLRHTAFRLTGTRCDSPPPPTSLFAKSSPSPIAAGPPHKPVFFGPVIPTTTQTFGSGLTSNNFPLRLAAPCAMGKGRHAKQSPKSDSWGCNPCVWIGQRGHWP